MTVGGFAWVFAVQGTWGVFTSVPSQHSSPTPLPTPLPHASPSACAYSSFISFKALLPLKFLASFSCQTFLSLSVRPSIFYLTLAEYVTGIVSFSFLSRYKYCFFGVTSSEVYRCEELTSASDAVVHGAFQDWPLRQCDRWQSKKEQNSNGI